MFGILQEPEIQKLLPGALKLKLKIMFTQAYVDHPTFGIQAKKELAQYQKQLDKLREESHA